MNNTVKNILIITGAVILGRYVYKKYLIKTRPVQTNLDLVSHCEAKYKDTKMSEEAKRDAIADCIENNGDVR